MTRASKLTVPVKYVRNDNITPFSRIDCTQALTIMPRTRRSIEIPLRSLICRQLKTKMFHWKETVEGKGNQNYNFM
jgi:hypothetical protein